MLRQGIQTLEDSSLAKFFQGDLLDKHAARLLKAGCKLLQFIANHELH